MSQTLIDPGDNPAKDPSFAGPCPRCGGAIPSEQHKGEYPGALSRYDNETYICSDCGTQEAFGAGHLVPLTFALESAQAKAIREEVRDKGHQGRQVGGGMIECDCGWISSRYAGMTDADRIYRSHLITAALANLAHTEGRHENGAREDLFAWGDLGCRECKVKVLR